jgi:hypothetical protein
MANELKHKSVGVECTQAEFEDIALHQFDSQATGDILYASSTTQLSRLGIGSTNDFLKVSGGLPTWTNMGTPLVVRKSADETVNYSTTLQDDDDLALTVGANEIWYFLAYIRHNSPDTADINFQFTVPTGGTLEAIFHPAVAAGTGALSPVTSLAIACDGTDQVTLVWVTYIGGANAGTVQLQWAQDVAVASDTKVLANSFFLAHRIA